MRYMKKRIAITLASLGTLLSVPAIAFAADPSNGPGSGGSAQGQVDSSLSGSVQGTLPFTGLNLALIVIAGVALLATGLLLRRRSRASD